jgi:hypothetical protein
VAITESGKVYTWGYGKDGQVNASAYRWCVLILMYCFLARWAMEPIREARCLSW